MKDFLLRYVFHFVVFCAMFGVYLSSHAFIPTTDSLPSNYTAMNLAVHRRYDLTNFKDEFEERGIIKTLVIAQDGQAYSRYPVMIGVLSVPVFSIANNFYGMNSFTMDILDSDYVQYIGKMNAALYVSLSGVLMYIVALRILHKKKYALTAVGLYAFATPVFNMAAQGNWQHGISLFFLMAYLVMIVKQRMTIRRWFVVSLILGFAYSLRLSNIFYAWFMIVAAWSAYGHVWSKYMRPIFAVVCGFLFGYAPQCIISWVNHIPGGYAIDFVKTQEVFGLPLIIQNVISLYISPNYGLWVFAPVCIFAVYTWIKTLRRQKNRSDFFISSTLVVTTFSIFASIWWQWTGGAALDARMLTETMPLFAIGSVFGFVHYVKTPVWKAIFFACVSWSLLIHVLTVYSFDWYWHDTHLEFGYQHQIHNAWIMDPPYLGYLLQKRQLKFEYMYPRDGYIRVKTINIDYSGKIIDIREDTQNIVNLDAMN